MLQFIKDSIREIKHVVWPTRKETQKYFLLVLAILIAFGTYLFLFSNLFSTIVFGIKDMVTGSATVNTEVVDTSFLDELEVTTGSGETINVVPEQEWESTEENVEELSGTGETGE